MTKTTLKVLVPLFAALLLLGCDEIEYNNFDSNESSEDVIINPEKTEVSSDVAIWIADIFMGELTRVDKKTKGGLGSSTIDTIEESGEPLMYVVNYPGGGFVIVGSTREYYPILAYSEKGSFKLEDDMGAADVWLDETKVAIKTSETLSDSVKMGMRVMWKNYESAGNEAKYKVSMTKSDPTPGQFACWERCDELQSQYGIDGWTFYPLSDAEEIFNNAGLSSQYASICSSSLNNNSPLNCSVIGLRMNYYDEQNGPLLETAWSQVSPYNFYSSNGYVGCGAVAFGQVMYYYKYPALNLPVSGIQITWNNIDTQFNGRGYAALLDSVGRKVNMHYWPSFSWATPSDMEDGIEDMGYVVTRTGYSPYEALSQIIEHSKPVIMLGSSLNSPLPEPANYANRSHYWVADGARRKMINQILFFTEWQPYGNGIFSGGLNSASSPGESGGIYSYWFHMNWGSGGSNDGWFSDNSVSHGNYDYPYNRQNYYITKP